MKKAHVFNVLFVLFLSFSCTNDDEDLLLNNDTNLTDPRSEIPCQIDFQSLSPNQTVLINCKFDLKGQTIVLPQNTTLNFDGGSIFNGTLNFNGGLIDGKLLNIDLQINGSVKLINTHFTFEKEKWNIIEGDIATDIALTNRLNLNSAISLVKSLRGTVFEINNIDAYFEVGAYHFGNYTFREAIQIPSNFHFKMGNNCTLRVFPNDQIAYGLLSSRSANNVKISGGHLIGDKYEHTYTTGTEQDTHEFGTGIYFVGVTNSEIDGVTIDDMTGDSFMVHSTKARNPDGTPQAGYDYSSNILIKNCIMRGARRDNLSLIDIDGLILENSIIANAGEGGHIENYGDTYDWRGVLPRCNIALEAARSIDESGNLIENQKIENIIIRNNIFTGAWISDINLHTCSEIEIYGNTFTSGISNLFTQNIYIYNNVLTHDPNLPALNIGIYMKEYIRESTGEEENFNFQIYNNTVTGFDTGIAIGGNNHDIYNNTIIDCVKNGISLRTGNNNSFYNNVITSSIPNSNGYNSFPVGISLTNTTISNETVLVDKYGVLFRNLSSNPDARLIINNCSFSGGFRNVDIRNSNAITVKNSVAGTIYQSNNTNIILENND